MQRVRVCVCVHACAAADGALAGAAAAALLCGVAAPFCALVPPPPIGPWLVWFPSALFCLLPNAAPVRIPVDQCPNLSTVTHSTSQPASQLVNQQHSQILANNTQTCTATLEMQAVLRQTRGRRRTIMLFHSVSSPAPRGPRPFLLPSCASVPLPTLARQHTNSNTQHRADNARPTALTSLQPLLYTTPPPSLCVSHRRWPLLPPHETRC